MKHVKLVNIDDVEEKSPLDGGGAWRRLLSKDETETGMIFGYGIVQPGDARGWHRHPSGEDETLFVVEGEALVEWKENGISFSKVAKAGSAFYTPGDMDNNLTNVGTTPLKAIYAIVSKKIV